MTTKQDQPQIADCGASANAALGSTVGSASSGYGTGTMLADTGTFGAQFISQIYAACIVSAGWQMGLNGTAGQNNPIVMPSYCQIQGTSQNSYNVENAASANMFISNMLPMMSILQFLFFALAPLAAAVMLFAGAQGVGIFTKYLMFGLWTQSWFPVAAVLNAYGQMTVSEELAKYGLAMTGGGSITPSATTFATMGQIPEVLLHVQSILGNVDMMLALTPVITMIVFTGSYMAMSQMAQDINGEVQTGKNVGNEAPSVNQQNAMAGVQPTGNPIHPGMYSASAAMDGISVGSSQMLNSGLSATVSSAAQHAQAANMDLGLTSMDAYAQQLMHKDGVAGKSSRDVTGSSGTSTRGQHQQGTSIGDSTDHTQKFLAEAAYMLATQNLAKSVAGKQMTPEQRQQAAEKEAGHLLENPSEFKAAALSAGRGGLAGLIGGFRTGLQAADAGAIAHRAAHDVNDTLASGSEAGVMTKLAGSLGISSADEKSLSQNKQVQDALKKAKSAQDTYQHVEQAAAQVGTSAGSTIGQGLDGKKLLSVMSDAGQGSARQGGIALLAGEPAMQQQYNQIFDKNRGLGPEQAAVTAYAATMRMNQASTGGLKALATLYNQPGMIGINPALENVLPMLNSVADDVGKMQEQTALTPQEQQRVSQLDGQNQSLPQEAQRGTRGAAAVRPSTPSTVGQGGMDRAAAFGSGQQQKVAAAYAAPSGEGAYHAAVQADPGTRQTADEVKNGMLNQLTHAEFDNPGKALAGLTIGNALIGVISNLMDGKFIGGKTPGTSSGKPAEPGNAAPDSESGKAPGAAEAPNGKGAPAAQPEPMGPPRETVGPPKPEIAGPPTRAEAALQDPSAKQSMARDAARAAMGEAPASALPGAPVAAAAAEGQVAARVAGQAAADAAAKEAALATFKEAGVRFVAKTAPAQAMAEVAASTGTPVGALAATAIEGGVLVMNASAAADVGQALYGLAKTYGTEGAVQVLSEAVDSWVASTNAGAAVARADVAKGLGLPASPSK